MATTVDWVLLGRTTGTGTTLSVTGLTTTAYKQIMIMTRNAGCSEGSSDLALRLNNDSSSVYGNTTFSNSVGNLECYAQQSNTSWGGNGIIEAAGSGTWQVSIFRFYKNGVNNNLCGFADKSQGAGTTRPVGYSGLLYGGSSAFTQVTMYSQSSRNFVTGATLEVWGLA